MSYRIMATGMLVALIAMGCGKDKSEGGEGGGGGKGDTQCSEKNDIAVSFGADDQIGIDSWKLEKAEGFFSGMVYNGKSVAKLGYVAFGNYPLTVGSFAVDAPKEQGKAIVQLAFKTENKPTPAVSDQKPAYESLKLATGDFAPVWMGDDPGFQVSVFKGPEGGGPALSGSGATGKAMLTAAGPDRLCGSIDFTSKNGTTVKGTFNVAASKDLWKKM